ncbi:class I glutamine amidotransferase-like protein [Tothia fuscella]|uniref:Class I glutamine amidotransferase-like protein n=1 Tax=Tothia fuscella TaxID=1048955 RepID=A0A9P4NWB3_9PEZI|nr:class I glutamine amidotransferase-like protein [Tothia fuscella]
MTPTHFGALVFEWQAMDAIGPFDLLNSSSKTILGYAQKHGAVTQETLDRAPDFIFHHIAEDLKPVSLLSSSITIVPTDTVDDCPELDHLLIGGPIPETFKLPQKYLDFISRHHEAGKTIFTTCTGAAVLASTSILDRKNATVNNLEYNWIKEAYPKVKWTREKKWVVDGNIWTGSGALAGMDMISQCILNNFGLDVLTKEAMGMDYKPRDIDGMLTVLPKRYDGEGKQISTHVFP